MGDLHADLCALAVKWLRRPNSAGGHGCSIAMSECRRGFAGETPDAIGFRANYDAGSIVVEVKVSRADFLADRAKEHRQPGKGMGNWRYFMAPAGLIRRDELPARWGLLEVIGGRRIRAIAGPAALSRNCGTFSRALDDWRHASDLDAERDLLVLMLARVADPETVNKRIREVNNRNGHLAREVQALRKTNDHLRVEIFASRVALEQASPPGATSRGHPRVDDRSTDMGAGQGS